MVGEFDFERLLRFFAVFEFGKYERVNEKESGNRTAKPCSK